MTSPAAPSPTPAEPIVCKPSPWFLLRAVAMLLMFTVFAVLFYIDGSTGYRKKNEVFYLHQTFREARQAFDARAENGLDEPEAWRAWASEQLVNLPDEPYVLPEGMRPPMPWPEVLQDYQKLSTTSEDELWREYSRERKISSEPPDEAFDTRKIQEQWWVFYACLALAIVTVFFLVRTLRRSIVADAEGLRSQEGRRVAYRDMKVLDLRKWDTKGLAFIDYESGGSTGRLRIDGLTYGGFKKEEGEPAERLMQFVRERFEGEIIEYAAVAEDEPAADGETPPADDATGKSPAESENERPNS